MDANFRNPLPIPEQCDACASFDVEFKELEKTYDRKQREWPYIYECQACGASVGVHANTRIPLGRMADGKTRRLRSQAHACFDPLWRSGAMTRTEAYELLSRHLGITREQCHISLLNVEQLKYVIQQCKGLVLSDNIKTVKRRKEKKNAKIVKRIEREKRQRFHKGKRLEGPNPFFRRARRSKQDSD